MANPGYVRSSDGNDADDGSTWALANATLAGAFTDAAAGDRIWISDNHAESTGSTLTLTCPGTLASPCQILFGDDAAEPPTSLVTTGSISTTTSLNIAIGGSFYWYGGSIIAGSGANSNTLTLCNTIDSAQFYEAVTLKIGGSGTSGRIGWGNNTDGQDCSLVLKNCTLEFSGTGQGIRCRSGIAKTRITGGALAGSAITNFIATANSGAVDLLVEGFDFSAGSSTMNLIVTGSSGGGRCVFRNCKLPASWSGSLFGGAPTNTSLRAEMHNCDSGDTNYRMWVEDYAGSTRTETTIVRSGGASDGTTTISWKMASSANAEYPTITLDSPEIVRWNDTTGSSVTVTVEVVTDNVTLTDAECWIEVQYLGTSGFPISSVVSDAKSSVIATAANQATSTETWTTTGLATPVKQKLSVSFTPQEKGFIHAVVKLAKASTTVYVDPELTVT